MNLLIADLVPSHVQTPATTAILHLKSLITFSLDSNSSPLISLFLLLYFQNFNWDHDLYDPNPLEFSLVCAKVMQFAFLYLNYLFGVSLFFHCTQGAIIRKTRAVSQKLGSG